VNEYGASEVNAFLCYEVNEPLPGAKNIPVGRPINNTEVYILDHNLQLVPIGLPGEVCVSSIGLARGYVQQEALTTTQFIPHPFSQETGMRLYKNR